YFLQVFSPRLRQGGEGQAGRKGKGIENNVLPKSLINPEWLDEENIKKRIADIKGDIYVIADTEEDEDIYRLADKKNEKASVKISKIMPENIIKTALIKKDEDISPLYLKPARYEMGNQRGS
ncbi:MAG: hypothetical protein KAI33_08580, partial [Elusimicrobiales bacterium]|nr:hypothetical protein [Elusimicrobiales bacterium]